MYRSLSTSRGAGNLFNSLSWYFLSEYSYLSTSRGAGNSTGAGGVTNSAIDIVPICLARGRKLKLVFFLPPFINTYRYLSTSRGAGNQLEHFSMVRFVSKRYSSLSTSGGDGNTYRSIPLSDSQTYRYLSTSRGAGNLKSCKPKYFSTSVQIPIYLERGRKHALGDVPYKLYRNVQIPIYLGRGRKRSNVTIESYAVEVGEYSYLSTSRGAGNGISHSKLSTSNSRVQIPIYLRRGRKLI